MELTELYLLAILHKHHGEVLVTDVDLEAARGLRLDTRIIPGQGLAILAAQAPEPKPSAGSRDKRP